MKKVLKVFSLLVMLGLALFVVACDGEEEEVVVEVSFTQASASVEVEKTVQLEVEVSDSKLELEYSSSDVAVATVDQSGKVTGVKVGSADITVKVKDQDVSDTITVQVKAKPVVLPTAVAVDNEENEGKVGQSFTFTAKVLPVGADQAVTWTTSNPNVVTIDEDGKADLVGIGLAVITVASVKDPSKEYEFEINVGAPDVLGLEIKSEGDVSNLEVFGTLQFSVVATPDLASNQVTWSVDNDALATISAQGFLVAKSDGVVTVKAVSVGFPEVFAEFELTLTRPEPTEVVVAPNLTVLAKDEDMTLIVTVRPVSAAQDVIFSSSNEAVVTVDQTGKVVAVGAGVATITIKAAAKESIFVEYEVSVVAMPEDVDPSKMLLDPNLTADRYEKITVDGRDYYMGLTAFTSAADAFAALEENTTLYVAAGEYTGSLSIKVDGVSILGPNAGIKGEKDLSARNPEAIFKGVIHMNGLQYITFDGIHLTGVAQIRSDKAVKNVLIENVTGTDHGVPAGEGVIYFTVAAGTNINENVMIKDSAFVDSKDVGYRAVRINNAKDLFIEENYFYGFTDTIRLEGENSGGLGLGYGAHGKIYILNNIFEEVMQYPIWMGTTTSIDLKINDNYIGTEEKARVFEVFGHIYVGSYRHDGVVSTIEVLRNEMPYAAPDWHNFRFNTGNATAEQISIEVHENIFHQPAKGTHNSGADDNFLIANHSTAANPVIIDARNNYFLFEDEMKATWFRHAIYEPYFTALP